MKIDKETLGKIAHLARINIAPEQEDGYMKGLEEVLTWVEKLNELDTEGVEPLTNMSFETSVMREDKRQVTITQDQALKNAPDKTDRYFKVPKVLG